MKKIRQLCLAALLTLAFALSATAKDEIECGRTITPPQSREGLIECGKLVAETVYTALTGVWIVL